MIRCMPKVGQTRRNGQISRNTQPSRLNQEETNNLNRLVTHSEIEYVTTTTKNLSTNKSP